MCELCQRLLFYTLVHKLQWGVIFIFGRGPWYRSRMGDFTEGLHPRDQGGKFATKEGAPAAAKRATETGDRRERETLAKVTAAKGRAKEDADLDAYKLKAAEHPICYEKTEPPPEGIDEYKPDVTEDADGDGVTDAARVGLGGRETSPPSHVPRLPNLTREEREIETRFADYYEKNPQAVVDEYQRQLSEGKIGDAPNVYATDDAKLLSPDYNPKDKSDDEIKEARSRNNVLVHQVANAVVKTAFLQKLDELKRLPPDDPKRNILVTSGGVAAGKGYAIGNVAEAKELQAKVGAVWDAAGEQNGTENPWVREECAKRGLNPVFLFVDADPEVTWASKDRGVVERAGKKGRMVDARLFADSYDIGAKNFHAFFQAHKSDTDFILIDSRGSPPGRVTEFPKAALEARADYVYAKASKAIDENEAIKPAVRRGASIGRRIWGPPT